MNEEEVKFVIGVLANYLCAHQSVRDTKMAYALINKLHNQLEGVLA